MVYWCSSLMSSDVILHCNSEVCSCIVIFIYFIFVLVDILEGNLIVPLRCRARRPQNGCDR